MILSQTYDVFLGQLQKNHICKLCGNFKNR